MCSEYRVYYVHCKFCILKNELTICTYQILASSWNFTKAFQSFVSYISFGNGLPSDPGTIPSRNQHLIKTLTAFSQMFFCGIASPEIRRLPRIGKHIVKNQKIFCEEH